MFLIAKDSYSKLFEIVNTFLFLGFNYITTQMQNLRKKNEKKLF